MARCRVMYTDEASKLLTDWLTSRGYEFAQSKLTADCAEYDVRVNNAYIKVWFDSGKQLFGFDRLHGGVKTGSFDAISEQFDNYIEINSVLIPDSKLIADTYERHLGIKTVFDTFVGRAETGYTVKFRDIANKAKGIRVKPSLDEDSVYQALYVEYTGDNSYAVLDELLYHLDTETGEVTQIQEEEPFSLRDLACDDAIWYESDEVLVYDKDNMYLAFEMDNDGVVLVRGNNGLYYTQGIKLVSSKSLDSLISEVLDLECWEHIPLYEELRDILNEKDELIIDGKVYSLRSKGTTLYIKDNNKWVEIKDSFALEGFIMSHTSAESVIDMVSELDTKGVSEEPTAKEEPKKEPVQAQMKDSSSSNIQIKKLMREGNFVFVRFVVDGSIYDIPPEKVEEYGLNTDRIKENSEVFLRFGMEMTEEELTLKKFATVVKTDDKIKEVIASLFR